MTKLTLEEIGVLENPTEEDIRILEKIKDTKYEDLLQTYDKYRPTHQHNYLFLQISWLEKERYFLGIKLNHHPTDLELIQDLRERHLAVIFKAFYVEKFPDKVEKLN